MPPGNRSKHVPGAPCKGLLKSLPKAASKQTALTEEGSLEEGSFKVDSFEGGSLEEGNFEVESFEGVSLEEGSLAEGSLEADSLEEGSPEEGRLEGIRQLQSGQPRRKQPQKGSLEGDVIEGGNLEAHNLKQLRRRQLRRGSLEGGNFKQVRIQEATLKGRKVIARTRILRFAPPNEVRPRRGVPWLDFLIKDESPTQH